MKRTLFQAVALWVLRAAPCHHLITAFSTRANLGLKSHVFPKQRCQVLRDETWGPQGEESSPFQERVHSPQRQARAHPCPAGEQYWPGLPASWASQATTQNIPLLMLGECSTTRASACPLGGKRCVSSCSEPRRPTDSCNPGSLCTPRLSHGFLRSHMSTHLFSK